MKVLDTPSWICQQNETAHRSRKISRHNNKSKYNKTIQSTAHKADCSVFSKENLHLQLTYTCKLSTNHWKIPKSQRGQSWFKQCLDVELWTRFRLSRKNKALPSRSQVRLIISRCRSWRVLLEKDRFLQRGTRSVIENENHHHACMTLVVSLSDTHECVAKGLPWRHSLVCQRECEGLRECNQAGWCKSRRGSDFCGSYVQFGDEWRTASLAITLLHLSCDTGVNQQHINQSTRMTSTSVLTTFVPLIHPDRLPTCCKHPEEKTTDLISKLSLETLSRFIPQN